ncbi:MAG TPA: IPT/TIG domain-containing protein [Candidatus Acidoferrales bacterium]|nr:IPT/TIG domain-containing protein [Candidatus Acidoferrales bacterium]
MDSKQASLLVTGVALCLLLPTAGRSQAIPGYTISTVAGNGSAGFAGDGSAANGAQLNGPFSAARDSSGNLYIADQFNHRIRMVDTSGNITTVAGNGTAGYTGDGGAPTSAELNDPQGVAVDSSGNIYIADTANNAVRKVSGGKITSIVGTPGGSFGYTGDGGLGTVAQVFHPSALALDSAGNLFIADTSNEAVRKLTTAGIISTFAGQGGAGFGGDGGLATRAQVSNPSGLAFDGAGNLFIADTTNNRIRMVAPNGIISTVAGSSGSGSNFAGDGGAATKARLNSPKGIAVDAAGNLFIADTFNNRIRVVATYGTIYTVAGTGATSSGGDGGPALNAGFFFPSGLVASAAGGVFVVDNQNALVRLLTPVPGVPAISAGGVQTAGAFGAAQTVAPGTWIEIYGSNFSSTARSWAGGDFVGVNAPTSLDATKVTIGSQAAFVDFISAGQVNAQVPSGVGTGQQTVTVSNGAAISAPLTVNVNATQPGLYAPPNFNIGGKQYLAALFPDGVTYVAPPGTISGLTSRQAKPGETIIVYGVGFGPVTPNIPAGQVAQQPNAVTSPLTVFFGQTAATLSYSGLAPGAVGLYQFNVVVPNVVNGDAVPITFPLGGVNGTQTLYTAVHN